MQSSPIATSIFNRIQTQKFRLINNWESLSANAEYTISDAKPNELICLNNCKNGSIFFAPHQRFTKLVVERCENCTIIVPQSVKIITNLVEITKCHDNTILFHGVNVRTIQCDGSKNNKLQFVKDTIALKDFCIVWSEDSVSNTVQVVTANLSDTFQVSDLCTVHSFPIVMDKSEVKQTIGFDLDHKPASQRGVLQYRSKFSNSVGDTLETVLAVREGAGYVTSASEKQQNDAKKEQLGKKLEEYLNEQFNVAEQQK